VPLCLCSIITMEILVTINGEQKRWTIQPSETLLEVLRREGYKGVKFSDDTGVYGTDTVLLNGKAVCANITMAAKADGAEITTIESLSKDGKLHPLQEAFIEHGAVQCGYQIPGMILTAKAFLDSHSNPTEQEVREAIIGNLDRDSGYKKPVEAIMAVVEGKRKALPEQADQGELLVVNKPLPKVDAVKLVTGSAKFTDDFDRPGMLYAKILKSPHAHARIKHINIDKAKALPGVHAVLTHEDLPKIRHTKAGQSYPEPSPYDHVILDSKVRFIGDRVALVAAESYQIAEEALNLIEVEYEVLPAVFDLQAAMQPGAPVIHDEDDAKGILDASRNLVGHIEVDVGDVEKGFEEADIVVENTYRTKQVKHSMSEPHVSMAYLDENERLVVISSTQVPFHTRRQLAHILQIPIGKIRVIKPRIGSGFGNKQGMHLEDVVAILALKTRRPVKMRYTREEEFFCGWTRHPQIIKMRTGAKKDGTIIANEMIVLANTGAYGDHAITVQANVGNKVLPLYPIPNLRFSCDVVYTNLPVCGAFRGYGATQGTFALESQIDELAKALNMDPLELRQKNRIKLHHVDPISKKIGESTHGKVRVIESCGLGECIEQGAVAIGWKEKRKIPTPTPSQEGNKQSSVKRGVGMACSMQGSGIPGVDWGAATVKMNDDGTFRLFVGATDIGTGSDTILAQIAAETLGVRLEDIQILSSDTDLTPFDVGAYASSTTYISGGAVRKAAESAKKQILQVAAKMMGENPENLSCRDRNVLARSGKKASLEDVAMYAMYKEKKQITVTESHLSDDSPPPFTAQFAEVEVDAETGEIKLVNYVAAVDCGVAINPDLAEGQVEGAVAQGIGYALLEEMKFQEGKLLNPNFDEYKIPTAADMPKLQTILVETHEPTGPYGAKSVAEVPINGPAPAIANAIADAIGVRITDLPITPEKVLAAIEAKKINNERG
jgi:putative selenate reductase molybdopterin-binding subunit